MTSEVGKVAVDASKMVTPLDGKGVVLELADQGDLFVYISSIVALWTRIP